MTIQGSKPLKPSESVKTGRCRSRTGSDAIAGLMELSTIPPKTILDLQWLFLSGAAIILFYTTKKYRLITFRLKARGDIFRLTIKQI